MLHEVTIATRPWLATCENASVTTAEAESASPAATARRTARRRPCERRPATALAAAAAPAPPHGGPRAPPRPRGVVRQAARVPVASRRGQDQERRDGGDNRQCRGP